MEATRTATAGPARIAAAAVAACVAALAGLAYLDWPLLHDGLISGEPSDARIQIAILQNWSNCLSGRGDCLSPNYFHPFPKTLGYNDGYLVSGVIFHAARRLGFDPFLSYEVVAASVRLIGFASVLAFGVSVLRLRFGIALLAAVLTLVSINTLNQVFHTQLLYGAFVPLALLVMVWLLRGLRRIGTDPAGAPVWPVHVAAVVLGALAFAWALTAFYSFFFFVLFAPGVVVVYLFANRADAAAVGRALRHRPAVIATLVVAALPAPLGLLEVYGGSLRDTGGHPWFAGHFPRFSDLLHVGPDNLVWGRLVDLHAWLAGRPTLLDELAAGYPALFLAGFLATAIWLVLRRRPPGATADPATQEARAMALALAVASAVTMLVVMRYGGNYSPWALVWRTVPGAHAIRVPGRFLLFLTPVLSLVLVFGLAAVTARLRPPWRAAMMTAAVVVLLIEQISVQPPFQVDPREERAWLAAVPPPPARCRAFAVTEARRGPTGDTLLDTHYIHAVDAMLVAALTGLPTVNGVASFSPKGWTLTAPFAPDYPERLRAYAAAHRLGDGLCGLDLKASRWSEPGE